MAASRRVGHSAEAEERTADFELIFNTHHEASKQIKIVNAAGQAYAAAAPGAAIQRARLTLAQCERDLRTKVSALTFAAASAIHRENPDAK